MIEMPAYRRKGEFLIIDIVEIAKPNHKDFFILEII